MLSGSATVTINVADDNDNSPVFIGVQFVTHIAENIPIGTSIIDVTAIDADLGRNSEIRFENDEIKKLSVCAPECVFI